MKFAPFAMALMLAAPALAPALAQDTTEAERLAVAQEYIALWSADVDAEAMAARAADPVIQQLRLAYPSMTAEQEAQVRQMFGAELARITQEILPGTAPDMAEIFTLEELTALRDFYATPEGRAVMRKMPQYSAAWQPILSRRVAQESDSINVRILEIVGETVER